MTGISAQRTLLKIKDVKLRYGTACVLYVPALEIKEGMVAFLNGPNGSGKSSLFDGLAGVGPSIDGLASYMSTPLSTMPAHVRAKNGLRLLPQGRRVFSRLTPQEHIHLAAKTFGEHEDDKLGGTLSLLRQEVIGRRAKGLSGGESKALLLASLMAPGLRLLMLDEPFAGLDKRAAQHVLSLVRRAQSAGVALIIADHTHFADEVLDPVMHFFIKKAGGGEGNVLYSNSFLQLRSNGI